MNQPDPFWRCTLKDVGAVSYQVCFYIARYSRGLFATVGYCFRDPTITVHRRKSGGMPAS